MMSDQDVSYPVPEFIPGGKGAGWNIQDTRRSGGQATMRPGTLHVPLGMACPMCGEAHSLAVRNHEVAHAAITLDKYGRMPVLPPGLREEYFQAVEDVRIWEHVTRSYRRTYGTEYKVDEYTEYGSIKSYEEDERGYPKLLNPPALCKDERVKWEAVYKGLDDKGRVLFAVAGGQSDEQMVEDIVAKCTPPEATLDGETILKIRKEALRRLTLDPTQKRQTALENTITPPITNTYRVAAWLQSMLEPPPEDESKEVDPNAGSDPSDAEKAEAREEKGESNELRQASAAEAEEEKSKRPMHDIDMTGTDKDWKPMVLDTPALERHLPGRLIAKYQSADEGTFIRRPDRLYTDQKVFGKKKRVQGGGVLIDDSGSMGLDLEEIMLILESCPGATIGVYSSGSHEGMVRIVAHNGKVVRDRELVHTPGGDNGVDGPALLWLAKQPHPRKVWVSDEQPTGLRSYGAANLLLQCQITCRKYNIQVVNPRIVGRANLAPATVNALTGRQVMSVRKGA